MTPQEQDLVNELFDRLAKLEGNPRDPSADRLIADGLRRAPHAVYALVQTTLVQDEALKRANARIEELQAQTGGEPQPRGGFLDSVRDEILGKRDPRGSVPSVRSQTQSSSTTAPPYPGMGPAFGSGGSFLTAASTAAGVIGGGLLPNSIRSMFGDHAGLAGHERSALEPPAPAPPLAIWRSKIGIRIRIRTKTTKTRRRRTGTRTRIKIRMTTPAILAGTIPITLSAPARHSGGGKEALEVSRVIEVGAQGNCSVLVVGATNRMVAFPAVHGQFAPLTVHKSDVL